MSKYRIAWLPGDGIGVEVMEAARIVLDALELDAEYVHGDIGWEFWCREGDAFPQRTIDLLKNVDAAMFGAITSKPVKAAEAELVPGAARARGSSTARRSCACGSCSTSTSACAPARPTRATRSTSRKASTSSSSARTPRTSTPASSSRPVPAGARGDARRSSRKPFAPFAGPRRRRVRRSPARSTRGRARSASSAPPSSSRGSTAARRSRSSTRPTSCAPPTACSSRRRKKVAKDFPEIQMDDANIDAICMWLLKNPFNYDVLVAPNLYGDIISDLCAQMVGGLGFGCSGNIGEKLAVFEPTHGSAPKYAGQYKVNPIATILAAKMMLDWLGETEKARAARGGGGRGHRRGQGPHLRHGRRRDDARDGPRRSRPARCRCRRDWRRWHGDRPPRGRAAGRPADGEAGRPDRAEDRLDRGARSAAGVDIVQVGSFVHPEKVPQMADTDELFRALRGAGPQAGTASLSGARAEREGPRARARLRRRACSAWASRPARRTAGRTPAWASRRRPSASSRWRRAALRRGQARAGLGAVGVRLRLRGPGPARSASSRSCDASSTRACAASASPTPPATRRPTQVERPVRRGPRPRPTASSAPATSTTPTASAWRTVYAALRGRRDVLRVARSPASAAARSRRWPAATSAPRTSSTSCSGAACAGHRPRRADRRGPRRGRVLRPRDAGVASTRPGPIPEPAAASSGTVTSHGRPRRESASST